MEILTKRPEIAALINSVAEEQGFDNYTIADIQTNKEGEGNLSLIFIIAIKDSTNKNLNVVIKAAFVEKSARTTAPIEKAFLNEIYFYTEVIPAVDDVRAPPVFLPKCYKTFSATGKEVLCLENLRSCGFEVFEKTKDLDGEHVDLIFKTYGQFHAYSFALQSRDPEGYGRVVGKLCNMYSEFLDNPNYGIKPYLQDHSHQLKSFLVEGEDDVVIEKFKKYLGAGIVEQISEVVTAKCEPSVVLHGDCWSNNMVFKYDELNSGVKKLVNMRFLDFQIAKEGSPVCDLSYCLYSGASKPLLNDLDKYLRIYYESFTLLYKELGGDGEKLFSFEVLKDHWKKYSRFGMIMALGILKMKCSSKIENSDSEDNFTETNVDVNEEKYKMRVKNLLKHMVEIDAL